MLDVNTKVALRALEELKDHSQKVEIHRIPSCVGTPRNTADDRPAQEDHFLRDRMRVAVNPRILSCELSQCLTNAANATFQRRSPFFRAPAVAAGNTNGQCFNKAVAIITGLP